MTDTEQIEQAFVAFVERVEPGLRRALVVCFGPVVGREACLDALSWGWEHWDRLESMVNPAGYLFRVGQTRGRRHLMGLRPVARVTAVADEPAEVVPELMPALGRLSEQQRVAVVLVHGYGYRQTEVAEMLGVAISTLREHLHRGVVRLRRDLEVRE